MYIQLKNSFSRLDFIGQRVIDLLFNHENFINFSQCKQKIPFIENINNIFNFEYHETFQTSLFAMIKYVKISFLYHAF